MNIKVIFKQGRDLALFTLLNSIASRKRSTIINPLIVVGYYSSQNLPFERVSLERFDIKPSNAITVKQIAVTITVENSRLIALIEKMPLSHRPEVIRRLVFLGLLANNRFNEAQNTEEAQEVEGEEVVVKTKTSSLDEPSSASFDLFDQ